MKRLRVRFPPSSEEYADTFDFLTNPGDAAQGEVRDVRLNDDGTITELCHITNPATDLEEHIAQADHVDDVSTIETPDGSVLVHQTLTPDDDLRNVLALIDRHHLSLETPIQLGGTGITVTVVGPEPRLRAAMQEVPAALQDAVTIESFTPYDADTRGIHEVLTDRQRTVLQTAVDLGYYATPREATIADLADALDLAPSTVSEHLRKLEARTLSRPT